MNKTIEQALKIARFDLGTAVKTKRAILGIVVYVGLALLVAAIWCFIQNKITAETGVTEQLAAQRDQLLEALTQKFGYDKAQLNHLTEGLASRAALMVFFWLTQSFMPVLIAVISADILNRDIRSRTGRFILLRSSRTSYFLGRTMSHGLLFIIAAMISWVVFMTYVTFKLNGFDLSNALLPALAYLGFTLLCGFCYLGLTALISSLVDGAGAAVLVTIAALIGLGVIANMEFGGWLSPSWYRYRLWSPYTAVVLSGIAAYVGFGLVFFTAAWARTIRRDV